jgi:hypothetical protein
MRNQVAESGSPPLKGQGIEQSVPARDSVVLRWHSEIWHFVLKGMKCFFIIQSTGLKWVASRVTSSHYRTKWLFFYNNAFTSTAYFGGEAMVNISEEEFYKYKSQGSVFPVILEDNADELTPIGIFYSLDGKNKFILESALGSSESGRYSFIGDDPYMIVRSTGDELEVVKGSNT